ncbi:transporter substrate-binding domain-containing protein [Paraburkholderia sediminicola]|uniref:transporter substrate-binding domain-containing protein n=1 Tax=Paraburkholderia sediminicola TaxID=458836 RepID=UPI0038B6FB33
MRKIIQRVLIASIVALYGGATYAGTLEDIQARGTMRVGVKADSVPYGFLDSNGQLKGAEIDLSRALAEQLHVKFEPVIVTSANRIQFLQQGKVDLLVATLADTPERRGPIDMIQPYYSSNGTNILARKDKHFTQWTQLKGLTLCGQQGSTFNKWVEQTYGTTTMTFPTIDEALAALRGGNCVAFVHNDGVIAMTLRNSEWKDYEMPLPSQFEQRHAIGVRKGDSAQTLGKFLSSTLTEWLKDGKLAGFYTAWKVTAFPPAEMPGKKEAASNE